MIYYRTGGFFSGLGGFFRGVVKTAGSVITAPAKLSIGAVGSVAKTAGNIAGSVIKATGLTGINIPGIGGLQFGTGGAGGAGAPATAVLPGGQAVAKPGAGTKLPIPWILAGVGGLAAIYFISRKK